MKKYAITRQQARRFLLAYQRLLPARSLRGKAGIMEYMQRAGCIQFDPLNVVGCNQELLLQARIAGFQPGQLQELLYSDRLLLDGWDKNLSIYCAADWPYFRRNREAAQQWYGRDDRPVVKVLEQVRTALRQRGPLSSADLDFGQTVVCDWAWAPTTLSRAALESMYFWGELIVHHKERNRKIYDFAHNHLPAELLAADEPNAGEADYHDWYVLRRIGAVGLLWNKAGDAWLGMTGIKSRERLAAMNRLLQKKLLAEVRLSDIAAPFFVRSTELQLLEEVIANSYAENKQAVILAPLDNLLWDRRMIKELFDFEYRWEVYKPAAERQYGYYVLPLLYGDRFVARLEPVRDKNGALLIKNWWWEADTVIDKQLQTAVRECVEQFMQYLGVERLTLAPAVRKQLAWLKG